MNLELLFFGKFREITEETGTNVTVKQDAELNDLIEHLVEKYGVAFRQQIDDTRGLRILINGREFSLVGGMKAPLNEGDTVVFLPPVMGG